MSDHRSAPAWLRPGYSELRYVDRLGDEVEVHFVNGDVVRVSPTRFGIEGDFDVRLTDEEVASLLVLGSDGVREISWEQIRRATDLDFAKELRRQDAEESKRIGRRLRALRENRRLSQKEVAQLLGMSSPQLSKIESGSYDLRVSTVQTLLNAMGATFADIAGPDALDYSNQAIRRASVNAGAPVELIDRVLDRTPRHLLRRTFQRAFGWSLDDLSFSEPSAANRIVNMAFKSASPNGSSPSSSPLTEMAVACAETVVSAVEIGPTVEIPEPSVVREQAADGNGTVTLSSLIEWTWNCGMPVVPLYGRGSFCAAAMSLDERPVIVLKDARPSAAFWLFDLAHELGHISHGHLTGAQMVVDVDQLHPDEHSTDQQEDEANAFALDLLLGGHADLVSSVRQLSRGNYLRFKGAVATVAQQAKVNPGLLGMVAAYELTDLGQPKDRWGSATNLAAPDGPGRVSAEAGLRGRMSAGKLTDEEEALLIACAFSE